MKTVLGWIIILLALICLSGCETAFALTGPELDSLVFKIIQAESSGNPNAVGPGGERGLMQITHDTWMEYSNYGWDEAFEPGKNIQVGRHILEEINNTYLNLYGSASAARIIYSYNTGLFCLRKHLPRWTQHHPNRIYREVFRHDRSIR